MTDEKLRKELKELLTGGWSERERKAEWDSMYSGYA